MPQLVKATIKARAAELRAEVAATRSAWLESLVGTELSILAEADGTGHAGNFARAVVPEGTFPRSVVAVTPRAVVEGLLR